MKAILKVSTKTLPGRILKRIVQWAEVVPPKPGTLIPFGQGIGQGVVTDVEVHIHISAENAETMERIRSEQAKDWQETKV